MSSFRNSRRALRQALRSALPTLGAALVLTACGQVPERPAEAPPADLQARVESARAEGTPRELAEALERLAASRQPPAATRLRLEAAEALADAGLGDAAVAAIDAVDGDTATDIAPDRWQLLRAYRAGQTGNPRDVRRLLEGIDATALAPAEKRRFLALSARNLERMRRPEAAIETRVRLAPLLEDGARRANREAIWRLVESLSGAELGRAVLRTGEAGVLGGWYALGETVHYARRDPRILDEAVTRWRERHPDHPAAGAFLDRLVEDLRTTVFYPRRIALLLPQEGPLATPGSAIQRGFLGAYLEDGGHVPVEIYDTTDAGDRIWPIYQAAVDAGAELVVGPLDKGLVQRLGSAGELPVPTLVFNYVAGATPVANLYQFGLLPEDEARQAADHALGRGFERAAILAPDTAWGERMTEAFAAEFSRRGGTVVASRSFRPGASDYSDPIRDLLDVDDSAARKRALQRILGMNVAFEARRRRDIDFIFLAAGSEAARAIRPQLRFHHAGDLPVLATSHVYAGRADRGRDVDMEGLTFCDAPWVLGAPETALETAFAEAWPDQPGGLRRLTALGVDGYRLIPDLPRLRETAGDHPGAAGGEPGPEGTGMFGIMGASGRLWMDELGRIHRELEWARFTNGLAKPLEAIEEPGPGLAQ